MLLPHVSLELLFVGDTLPPELDGQQFLLQRDVSPPRAREGFSSPPTPGRSDQPHSPLCSLLEAYLGKGGEQEGH